MKFSNLFSLLFFSSYLFCMEVESEENVVLSAFLITPALIVHQPSSLANLAAAMVAEMLLSESNDGKLTTLIRSSSEPLLNQEVEYKIISHIYRLKGPLLWRLFSPKIEFFDLDLSHIENIGLTNNGELITFKITPKEAKVVIRSILTHDILQEFSVPLNSSNFHLTKRSNMLFLFDTDNIIYVYNLTSGNLIQKTAWTDYRSANPLAISDYGHYIYQPSNNSIRFFNVSRSETVQIAGEKDFQAETTPIAAIQTISNERFITITTDGSIKIWKLTINQENIFTDWPQLLKTIPVELSIMHVLLGISEDGNKALLFGSTSGNRALYSTSLDNFSSQQIGGAVSNKRPKSSFDGTLFLIPQSSHNFFNLDNSLNFKNLVLFDTTADEAILSFNLDNEELWPHDFHSFFITPDNRFIILYTKKGQFIKISLKLNGLDEILERLERQRYKRALMPKCIIS